MEFSIVTVRSAELDPELAAMMDSRTTRNCGKPWQPGIMMQRCNQALKIATKPLNTLNPY